MKLRILALAAALMMSTSLAYAAFDVDAITQQFTEQGYTRIEVMIGLTQAKLEAIKDGTKVEVIFDLATGDVLKSEAEPVDGGDDTSPGVFVRNENRDFLGDGNGDDDDHGGNSGPGGGGDDDDEDDDDNSGPDDGDDDDDDDEDRSGSNRGHG